MLAIASPLPQYPDLNGGPLDAGYLYFGVINLNPVTSPTTVYWDAAGTQPAAQPIRTLNGMPARMGTPAAIYVAGDYSLLVKDLHQRNVFYAPTSAGVQASLAQFILDLANDTDSAKGAALIGVETEGTDAPDKSLGQRIHRDYINVGDIGGTDNTGTVDNTAKVLAAIATGKLVRLDGFYRISSTLTNPLVGIFGDGPRKSGLIVNGVDAITFTSNAGLDRRPARFEDFAVDSLANSCDGKFVFHAPGVAAAAAAVYNSGLIVRGLEIGRNGRMGGGFSLKDFFRVNIEDVGFTDVSWMVRLIGSVVQLKMRNLTSNNDSAAATLSRYGISTEVATYDIGSLVPENVRAIDCSYIRGDRGISHTAGLDFETVNFDTEAAVFGALLNAACTMRGGIIVPSTAALAWVGISRGVAISDPDDATIIEGVDINCLRAPGTPASSYGMDLGDGVSPVFGLIVRDCRIRGIAGSLVDGMRGRDLRDATVQDNFVRSTVVTGSVINLTGRRMWVDRNRGPSGTMTLSDGGDATAYGSVIDNQVATLNFTPTTPGNWSRANPEISTEPSQLAGSQVGTYVTTLTGCTTSPTTTLRWEKKGRQVSLQLAVLNGTSNSTAATLTGMPAALFPARPQNMMLITVDNGVSTIGKGSVGTDGVITLNHGPSFAAFTAAGVKGVTVYTAEYSLD